LTVRGAEVVYVTLTDGSAGTRDLELTLSRLAEIRRREQEEARILGVKELIWLGYRDAYLPYSPEVRDRLIYILRKYRPEVVLAPDPLLLYEVHPDHRHAGFLAAEASFFTPLPNVNRESLSEGLTPFSPTYVVFYFTAEPNVYIDVAEVLEYKIEAVKGHRSHFGKNIEGILRRIAEEQGSKIGVKYAEAFKAIKPYCLHCLGFFSRNSGAISLILCRLSSTCCWPCRLLGRQSLRRGRVYRRHRGFRRLLRLQTRVS